LVAEREGQIIMVRALVFREVLAVVVAVMEVLHLAVLAL
jgi:hypothetical protein